MKVSGFTFIRNAVQYDFPIVEAVTSVLPIVDEFIVKDKSARRRTNVKWGSRIESCDSFRILDV